MKCPKCGNENAKGAVCDKCGATLLARLSDDNPEENAQVNNPSVSFQPQDSPLPPTQSQVASSVNVQNQPQTLSTNVPDAPAQPENINASAVNAEQKTNQPTVQQPTQNIQTTPEGVQQPMPASQPTHPIPPAKVNQATQVPQDKQGTERQDPSSFEIPADFKFSDEVDDDGSSEIDNLQVKVEEEDKTHKKPKKKNKKRIKRKLKKIITNIITIVLIGFVIYYVVVHYILPNHFIFGLFEK